MARRVKADEFSAVIRDYLQSAKHLGMAASTRRNMSYCLRLAQSVLGGYAIDELRPSMVQAFIDELHGRPGTQRAALDALKALEKWGVVLDRLPRQITFGVRTTGRIRGHIPWTDEQVELALQHVSPGLARIIIMAANTGQRQSDLARMLWSDIEVVGGRRGINVRGGQKKTGRQQWVPFTQELERAMSSWDRSPGHILRKPRSGQPWQPVQMVKKWIRERNEIDALAPLRAVEMNGITKPLTLHGLRGTACVRLLRAGATTRQIADMVGMSEKTVVTYTRFSEQKANALAAVYHLDVREERRKRGEDKG